MLIAVVSIIHVVIAHFAVGGGIFMAVVHTLALRRNDALLMRYLKDHAQFLVLFAFVAGALTGVGIWLSIGLVSPAATSRLIHNFVWGWAAEWCFFAIEIVAGYVYYYGFGRLPRRTHLAVVWIYAVSAFFSLVIINGILTFMLTPSRWAELVRGTADFHPEWGFWLGIFNDTYWPSLLMRTVSCLALAAIFVAVIVNLRPSYTREERQRIINIGAYFMAPLALMVPIGIWYFAELPPPSQAKIQGGAIAMTLFFMFGFAASLLIGGYAYFGMIRAKRYISLETSLLLLGIAFIATGSMEFVREGVRKPYVIYGVLYSNGVPAYGDWPQRLQNEGGLAFKPFARRPGQTVEEIRALPLHEAGEYVFRAQCRSCHEVEGFNGILPLVENKSRRLLLTMMHELDSYSYMPPFLGDEFELRAIVEFMTQLHEGDAYTPMSDEEYDRMLGDVREELRIAKSEERIKDADSLLLRFVNRYAQSANFSSEGRE